MKALGVKNRCRVRDIPPNIPHIVAPPRMQLYIDCAAAIHGVFLRYVAPEDIYTYSIDESFIDVTPYLKMYGTSARELAKEIIQSVREIVGTVSTCGIGTNMYLFSFQTITGGITRNQGVVTMLSKNLIQTANNISEERCSHFWD